jgi:hypothetical protein
VREMSRTFAVICAIALAPACLAQRSPVAARDSAAIIAIAAIEHEWIGNRDSTTLDRILAPDFEHPVSTGDVLDKKTNIAWLVQHPVPPSVHFEFASLRVRVYGDAAIATGIVRASDDAGAELSRNVFTDVFIRRDGRWQAVSAEETDMVTRAR